MTDRDVLRARFVADQGWGDAVSRHLAGDASFRRYFRLDRQGATTVVMDAPPPNESVERFLAAGAWLAAAGATTPEVHAADVANGFLLLEDLGDGQVGARIDRGADPAPYLERAVDLLLHLHRHPAPDGLTPFDDDLRIERVLLLADWYAPAVLGAPLPDEARARYEALWRALLADSRYGRPVFVHRDFFADNLVWLPEREGLAQLGVIDFQDGGAGPPAYDLMALGQDARRDTDPALGDALVARYLAGRPDLDPARFRTSLTVLAAQRHCRVIGLFTRLAVRDGKPWYLDHIPRLWRYLDGLLQEPVLAPIARWLDTYLPPGRRIIPPRPR
ncbi:aminoglycoside phosphotransferase family protein [Marinivivus vitaminiproducens]|uniref:aminoglycoside phosphotransferase family protein n=1 Tax=Marinivivus vitaminiproducens TaxID=3035935 RepID=UPI00279848D8|nr:phosphotransferase [Geminicoccaceae bacterium SCSIO 64248]